MNITLPGKTIFKSGPGSSVRSVWELQQGVASSNPASYYWFIGSSRI